MDRINYEWMHSSETAHISPEDWEQEHGLLRMTLKDEILYIPLEHVNWIVRDKDD